jgi:RNA polymerase sigma-70 factor (ECF subfamily)
VIYCVVPRELAASLHDVLRRHFRDDPDVEVVVERRTAAERRAGVDRRAAGLGRRGVDRRRIRAVEGRRVAHRRAPVVDVEPPALPRRARGVADRLTFVERIEPTTEQAEDAETARLVTRIQSGDREGYAELYMRYFDRVYGYAHMLVRDPHEAEDLTQQVFVNTLEALPRYERRRQPFRAWLFTIVRNTVIAHLKRTRRLEVAEPAEIDRRREGGAHPADNRVLTWIADRELLMFVERLPLQQRQILVMRFMLDLTSAEIAQMLGLTSDAVRSQQARAMRALRKRLAAVGRTSERRDRWSPVRRGVRQAPVLRHRRFALLA